MNFEFSIKVGKIIFNIVYIGIWPTEGGQSDLGVNGFGCSEFLCSETIFNCLWYDWRLNLMFSLKFLLLPKVGTKVSPFQSRKVSADERVNL